MATTLCCICSLLLLLFLGSNCYCAVLLCWVRRATVGRASLLCCCAMVRRATVIAVISVSSLLCYCAFLDSCASGFRSWTRAVVGWAGVLWVCSERLDGLGYYGSRASCCDCCDFVCCMLVLQCWCRWAAIILFAWLGLVPVTFGSLMYKSDVGLLQIWARRFCSIFCSWVAAVAGHLPATTVLKLLLLVANLCCSCWGFGVKVIPVQRGWVFFAGSSCC